MAIYLRGQQYTKAFFGGQEISKAFIGGNEAFAKPAAVDRPGTLTVGVTRSGRNYNFVLSITDPDGIRSLTSATFTDRTGSVTADVLGDFSRSNANTFAGTDTRRNIRWSRGSLTVVYVDATSGQSQTLTTTWTPPP